LRISRINRVVERARNQVGTELIIGRQIHVLISPLGR